MSYRAKRITILLMAWGLLIFTAVHVRLALNEGEVRSAQATSLATPTPAIVGDDRVSQLQAILTANPQDLSATVELAAILYGEQDYESALLLYQRAAILSPHNVDLLIKIGACQLYTLDIQAAADSLNQAVTLDQTRPDAHLLYGLALSSLTPPQMDQAKAEWLKAEQLAPGTETAKQARTLIDQSSQ